MDIHNISMSLIQEFAAFLHGEGRSQGTIEKYTHDVSAFADWLDDRSVSRENAVDWREYLLQSGYAPVTINSMIASLNSFFRFCGFDCRVKFLKVQRQLFREKSKDLSREEYERLLETARTEGKNRLALLMETICASGIRVSEVQYITVEAAQAGRTTISMKGKIRTILLPGKLCRKLLKYAGKQKIASGEIFLTRSGKSLSRRQIWAEMKRLCADAGVEPSKVFPHNLRHLFATVFYKACKDIAKLADVLGHSSIETTRIYLLTTEKEHQQQIELLGLVS